MLMRCWATSSHLCLIVWFQSDSPRYAWSPLCPINACSPAIMIDRPMLRPPAWRKQSRKRTWCTAMWFSFVCVCLYVCVYIWEWKSRWFGLGAGREGDDRGWDGWVASLTQWIWVWINFGSSWWTGWPDCCSPWGHKELDTTERLKWTELS